MGKAEPDAGRVAMALDGSGQLSVAVTVKLAAADAAPSGAVVTISAGHDAAGSGFTIFVEAAEKLLLASGSGVDDAIVAILRNGVPPAAEQLMAPTSVMFWRRDPGGNVTVRLLPDPSHVAPPVAEHETKLSRRGRLSVTVELTSRVGPLLVASIV